MKTGMRIASCDVPWWKLWWGWHFVMSRDENFDEDGILWCPVMKTVMRTLFCDVPWWKLWWRRQPGVKSTQRSNFICSKMTHNSQYCVTSKPINCQHFHIPPSVSLNHLEAILYLFIASSSSIFDRKMTSRWHISVSLLLSMMWNWICIKFPVSILNWWRMFSNCYLIFLSRLLWIYQSCYKDFKTWKYWSVFDITRYRRH